MEFIVHDTEHIQVNDLILNDAEEYRAFWQELLGKHEGSVVDFCYHNCAVPTEFMAKVGANLLESCVETRLAPSSFTPVHGADTTLITHETFASFKALHDAVASAMYWTSERVLKALDRWRIYMYGPDYVMMSLWSDESEIFMLKASNAATGAALLTSAAAFAFESGKHNILYMVDDDDRLSLDAALSAGFSACGRYVAYRGVVKEIK